MDILSEVIDSVRIGRAEACRVKESGSWGMRFPAFADSGFHILLRGSAWLITATGRPRALRTGDVVLAPFGAEHGLSHEPCLLKDLPPAVMSEDPHGPDPADVEFLSGAYWLDLGQVHPCLGALPEVLVVSPPGGGVIRPAPLDLLMTHVLRQWLESNRDAHWPEIGDPAISVALREIHTSPHKPWTVQQLGRTAGMSRTAFTKRFTALVGKPPMTYVTGWRLRYGARLLRETNAPLAAIARQVGYSTEFAFGAAFRREYGIAPGRFRKGHSRSCCRRTISVIQTGANGEVQPGEVG
ncbi:AraC family transcriptional regulator [Streptomyces sp. GESEQ-4]|uniref:helix-turn-helix transcriptional regulator n=1 Tax=Streptomyces sp. GESEQ-4 TaxID=2812655 RepID=UPI001B3374E2|nr:AraC family transcriptional regulator [Streptomyces sp. GESEQ-4]